MKPQIRFATPSDAEAVCRIYNHYVENSVITFETEAVSTPEMMHRIREILDAGLPWLVAEDEQTLIGYAYASKWKSRCAYRFSVESTVYLSHELTGNGFGSLLMSQLLPAIARMDVHAVIAGIALLNARSVTLHEKFGFHKVAHFEEVGNKFDQWIDVGYWEKILGK